jgi:glycosyltransferase involved in cell wall biosynthesis
MLKFGIVIPTFNRKDLLKRALDSVLNQTYDNYIICVVEDCSPDDTKSMIEKEYINNVRVHYIRLPQNSGVNVTRNTAMDYLLSNKVKCDYISFLDDDDYFYPNTLSEANKQIDNSDTKWLVFNKVFPNGEKITKVTQYGTASYLRDYFTYTRISGDSTMFISRELIGKKRYEPRLRGREYLFYLLLDKESDIYIYDFSATVCEYLDDGMTHSQERETKQEKRRIRNIENSILETVGHNFISLEYIRAKALFQKSINDKNFSKGFKFFRHLIKWKLKSLF